MNLPGYEDYYKSQNPGYTGTATGEKTMNEGERDSLETRASGGNGNGGAAEPPSLLKPLLYATATVAAFTLLT